MVVDFSNLIKKGETIAVALSGGADSMALLHILKENSCKYQFNVIAINIEHGIRGEESKSDSAFVKEFCLKNEVPLLFYEIDTPKKAKEDKLSIEQAGRILRYNCFYDAINSGKCDKVATAHHLSDNAESILFNVLRGTGIAGLKGIFENYSDKIIRPLINVSKSEILDYIKANHIPYRTDSTNLDDNYTRNYIRLNVLPEIKKIFPEVENSLSRLSTLATIDDDYLQQEAFSKIKSQDDAILIDIDLHPALLSRCVIIALKKLGVQKDWEKTHIDSVIALKNSVNGASVDMPQSIRAIREYDHIVLFKNKQKETDCLPFGLGKLNLANINITIELVTEQPDIKNGFYADLDKIPKTAQIRTCLPKDMFTKFGGGTKKLCDYFTDKKVPKRIRQDIPLLVDGSNVLAIFGMAISENIKIENNTKKIIKLTKN